MKINELAKCAGLTVRTLHYYDEIGLLKPSYVTEAGYRVYDEKDLERLQQILFFRELEFPLAEIRRLMENPAYDKAKMLKKHEFMLVKKRDRLNGLIDLVRDSLKGERTMHLKEFDNTEIEALQKQYAEEVKERWGNTEAYTESQKKTASYNTEQWREITESGNAILKAFGDSRHLPPESGEAQALVKRWQSHISKSYYACTKEILCSLGAMYTGDPRFTANIDKYGAGTAAFMEQAIAAYCKDA